MTVRMFGNNGLKPPSNRAAAFRLEMSAALLCMRSAARRCPPECGACVLHALVRIESPNAAMRRSLDFAINFGRPKRWVTIAHAPLIEKAHSNCADRYNFTRLSRSPHQTELLSDRERIASFRSLIVG